MGVCKDALKWVVIKDRKPPKYVPIFLYDSEFENFDSLTVHQDITMNKVIENNTHWMLATQPD